MRILIFVFLGVSVKDVPCVMLSSHANVRMWSEYVRKKKPSVLISILGVSLQVCAVNRETCGLVRREG